MTVEVHQESSGISYHKGKSTLHGQFSNQRFGGSETRSATIAQFAIGRSRANRTDVPCLQFNLRRADLAGTQHSRSFSRRIRCRQNALDLHSQRLHRFRLRLCLLLAAKNPAIAARHRRRSGNDVGTVIPVSIWHRLREYEDSWHQHRLHYDIPDVVVGRSLLCAQ